MGRNFVKPTPQGSGSCSKPSWAHKPNSKNQTRQTYLKSQFLFVKCRNPDFYLFYRCPGSVGLASRASRAGQAVQAFGNLWPMVACQGSDSLLWGAVSEGPQPLSGLVFIWWTSAGSQVPRLRIKTSSQLEIGGGARVYINME